MGPPEARLFRLPLRSFVLLVSLASLVPLAVFTAWLQFAHWREERSLVDQQNIEVARAISVSIDQEVESTVAALRVLASLDALHAPALTRAGEFERVALRTAASQPRWRAVALIDPEGTVLVSSSSDGSMPLSFGGSPWFERLVASRRAVASDLLVDPVTGHHYVTVGVPVLEQGELRYVVAAEMDSTTLSDILRRQSLMDGAVVTLLDRTRTIMARTRGESSYVGQHPGPRFLQAAGETDEGAWRDVLLEGGPAYAALSRSGLTGWIVGVDVVAETIDGPNRRSALELTSVGLLLLGVGVVTSARVGRGVGTTLGAISTSARALAQGEAVEPPASVVRELDELSAAVREACWILDQRLEERDRAEQQRQAALEASERNETRLTVTLESIGDAVIATDADARITLINPVAEELTQWSRDEALGRPVEEILVLLDERTADPVAVPMRSVMFDERALSLPAHTRLVGRHGRQVPVEDSIAPIRSAEGDIRGLVLVFRDVTEARLAEEQRAVLLEQEKAARQQAEALSREKDAFVATVSHELRNPLNAILGWVTLMRSHTLDEATRQHAVEVLERNARSQSRLIDDLLDVSRITRGKLRLDMRPVDLASVAEAAVTSVEPTVRAKDLELSRRIEPGALVLGDRERLQQVLWNLLTNAIKFTSRGGHVRLSVSVEDPEVVVKVSDDGMGIPATLLPRIFERFTQGEKRAGSGLGIGLALVRQLVELHGGVVSAASEGEGRGAEFAIRLPLLDALAAPEWTSEAESAPVEGTLLDGLRVLVVEDDPDSRDLASTTLRRAGAEVSTAATGRDALEALDASQPELVFTDINMPELDGYELLAHLRARPRYGSLPVVAVTAYARAEDKQRALEAGFDDHLGKPVDPAALVRMASTIARRTRSP